MDFEDFIHPDAEPSPPPSEGSIALARQLLAAAGLHPAGPSTLPPQAEPEPRLTHSDLCERYIATHQPTVYAEGRFWRCPTRRRWQPVSHEDLAREVLNTLHTHQENGVAPHPRTLAAVIDLLRLRLGTILPEHWDNPAGFLPFSTQRLEIQTGEWWPLTAGDYLATTLPYDYDYDAQAPVWHHFLETTVPDAASFLQEFAGYCLLPDNHHELSLWLFGPPTSGKSTCLLGLQTLLGPFAGTLALDDVASRKLDPAFLRRKRLLICHEPPIDHASVRLFRSLVSGKPLALQRPHRSSVTVQSSARLALTFHTLPSLEPEFESLYHRAALVVFPARPKRDQDPTLKHRLAQEGPGLFNWARQGLHRLYHRGRFDPPATMLAAAARLRLTHDAPAAFVKQCCHVNPNGRTQATHLHNAFVAWSIHSGLEPMSARALATEWERLGFIRHRLAGVSHWFGVDLLPSAQLPPAALNPNQLPGEPQ